MAQSDIDLNNCYQELIIDIRRDAIIYLIDVPLSHLRSKEKAVYISHIALVLEY